MTTKRVVLTLIIASTCIVAGASSAISPQDTAAIEVIGYVPLDSATCRQAEKLIPREKPTGFADSLAITRWLPRPVRSYLSSVITGNIDRTREKRFDVSYGIIPTYSREASIGLGAVATGLYRVNRADSIGEPSDVYASLSASINCFYEFIVRGNTLFADHRSRLTYRLEMYRKHLKFYGITGQESATNKKSYYDRRQIDLFAEYVYRLGSHYYIGVNTKIDYTDARNLRNPEYLLGEPRGYFVSGIGCSIEYDTRDNIMTPTRGVHLVYRPVVFPKFMGNAPNLFYSNTVIADGYVGMWKGSVLAIDFYGVLGSKHTPWTMLQRIAADGIRMRGYYMGSYVDRSQLSLQIELRQKIYKRLGAVAWVGGAAMFSSLKDFRSERANMVHWLPNYGVGLRFEFKHNINVRMDCGFGRNTMGILFTMGEAF